MSGPERPGPGATSARKRRRDDRARGGADDDVGPARVPSRDVSNRGEHPVVERVPNDAARAERESDARHSSTSSRNAGNTFATLSMRYSP